VDASLNDFFCYMVSGRGNNFYARILAALETHETRAFPAMAVTARDRHFVLLYNPDWIKAATFEEVVAVTEHECLHLVLEHLARHLEMEARFEGNDEMQAKMRVVEPFAADLAVNTLLFDSSAYVKEHASEWVMPKHGHFADIPHGESYEWYVQRLARDVKVRRIPLSALAALLDKARGNSPSGGGSMFEDSPKQRAPESDEKKGQGAGDEESDEKKGQGAGDEESDEKKGQGAGDEESDEKKDDELGLGEKLLANHADWDNTENKDAASDDKMSLADELGYQVRNIVQKAVDDHKKSRGTFPAGLVELINKLLKKPQVPWTTLLRNMVVRTQRYRWRRSCARLSRRRMGMPQLLPLPGKKKDRKFTVAFMDDTSGSMGQREREMALNELAGLQKADKDIKIHVIQADAAVELEYVLGENTQIQYKSVGRGGTNFDAAMLRAQELDPDIAFYFTDGYAPAPQKESRLACPFVWIITPNGKVPDESYGRAIKTRPYE
jgi:predicted metal-dependent peptidase